MTALLAFDGLSKAWFGVPAVEDVTLDVRTGRVLGLIGENGAGKSTLMNMVGGVVRPSGGAMRLRGRPYEPASAADATRAGIAFIHQELNLFPNLSIAENVFIDGFPTRWGLIDRRAIAARTAELLAALDLNEPPETPVAGLPPGERQLVEIAKALHREAELIIFDEPTTSLTPRETARLFEVVDRLRATGRTVIYISHILSDVQRLCDDVAVLRDGRLTAAGEAAAFDIPRMIESMIGRALSGLFPEPTRGPPGAPLVVAEGLGQPGVLEDVSFSVGAGEILGLFGLMGSGRTELARILAGLDPVETGRAALAGRPLEGPPRARVRQGLAFVTEDRRAEGLMLDAPIADNLALAALAAFAAPPFGALDRDRLAATSARIAEEVRLKAADIATQPARALSGGNQQKVVIGKWLMTAPRFFILDEPTRGVDVGAKYEIYALADRLAAGGAAILFISSEIEELMGVCDRILVMRRGEVAGAFPREGFDRRAILGAAFGEGRA